MTALSRENSGTHLWVADIREEDQICGSYLVKEKKVGTTRRGEPFISLTLADRTGEIDAKVWEKASEISPLFQAGEVVEVEGVAGSYRDQIQVVVSAIKARTQKVDASLFLESSPHDPPTMMGELRGVLREIQGAHLRRLIDSFLGDREFVSLFKKAPAAKNFHHCYLGGLLEHTLSVCKMAARVAEHYPGLDRDLLLASAFLHDIGKIRELTCRLQIDYTDEGRLLGHLVLGVTMIDEKLGDLKTFPEELGIRLKHLILSHHGHYEFGSPKRPKFLEGFALHLIDDLDAKLNGLSRFMERDRQEGSWTGFNRLFERYLLKGEILPMEKELGGGDEDEMRQGKLFSA